VTEHLLTLARAGDAAAFGELAEPCRRNFFAVQVPCSRKRRISPEVI